MEMTPFYLCFQKIPLADPCDRWGWGGVGGRWDGRSQRKASVIIQAKEDTEFGQASNKESLGKCGVKGELGLLFWLC